MASSKPLTEEQLQENIFGKIMHNIMKGRFNRVASALDDNPRLKKAAKEADNAIKDFEKVFKKHTKGRKVTIK
jgi:hypothetical protein|tara:strand:- start:1524 stop:1742 length:219 start_codon:yes stop_codon:yes gene_type:complete